MLGGVKKFIKANFINDSYPFLMWLWQKRYIRIELAIREAYFRMNYAEVESAISRQHHKMFGRTLNWDNPQTYNEKIHVSALYMPTPLKTRLADKIAVREWITERIGSEYLIPLLGVYDSFDEIDFDALPDSFVMKCNHDCGSVTLVKDKRTINRKLLKLKYDFFMSWDYAWHGCEMHYRDIPHKIMIEQYMGEVNDYKFNCFGGNVYYCAVDFDRYVAHKRNVYDLQWMLQPFNFQPTYINNIEISRPQNYDEMIRVAKVLCADFDQVRVDLYLVNEHIYCGEMTFTDCNGFSMFTPSEWDYKLGALWPFDNTVRAKVLAEYSRPADYQNP